MTHNLERLRGSLAGLSAAQIGQVVIADEPVWAIGTGRVASAAEVQEVCHAIRGELPTLSSSHVAGAVRVTVNFALIKRGSNAESGLRALRPD